MKSLTYPELTKWESRGRKGWIWRLHEPPSTIPMTNRYDFQDILDRF